MPFLFLLLFISVPVIEIAVFIQVGDEIGLWSTIGLIILTAIIGTALLRQQGLQTLMRAQTQMQQGALPAQELFNGACLLIAGLLLLTPGFVTDSIGFLLFVPLFRVKLGGYLLKNIAQSQRFKTHFHQSSSQASPSPSDPSHPIIDVDYEDISPRTDSPWHNTKD